MDNVMIYSLMHVEKYGHGKPSLVDFPDNKIVTFQDHDGYFDVYECESDEQAQDMADWYLTCYESYPGQVEIVKQSSRYFTIETS